MNPALRASAIGVAAASLASAVAVAASPTWGWLAVPVIAAAGAVWLRLRIGRDWDEPMERLADAVRPHAELPDVPADELARLVASEYRDVVQQLAAAAATSGRREHALGHVREGVILIDPHGLVEYANPAAKTMVHGRMLDVVQRFAQPDLERLVSQAAELGAPMSEEVLLRVPGPRPALARAVPLSDGSCVLLLADLSESYRLDQVRRDFVANVSHELKTPVSAVRALADVAASALGDGNHATATRFVQRLGVETDRLAKLVGDLLDLSRVESGEALRIESVELKSLLEAAADAARTLADDRRVEVSVEGPLVRMEADAQQLRMAVQNLVENAVRYSDRGTVRLEVRPGEDSTAIVVSDEGIGIPADELSRIFERFYRVDRARSRATGGTGLGLAIVRHVAENHGGRVEVSSELGRGSQFTLWVPLRCSDEPGSAA